MLVQTVYFIRHDAAVSGKSDGAELPRVMLPSYLLRLRLVTGVFLKDSFGGLMV